jgi:hypothetical protein
MLEVVLFVLPRAPAATALPFFLILRPSALRPSFNSDLKTFNSDLKTFNSRFEIETFKSGFENFGNFQFEI